MKTLSLWTAVLIAGAGSWESAAGAGPAEEEVLVPVRGFRNRAVEGETPRAAGFRGRDASATAEAAPTIPPGVDWPGPELEIPGPIVQEPPREIVDKVSYEASFPAPPALKTGSVETPASVLALKPVPEAPSAAESLAQGAATGDEAPGTADREWLTWPMIAALLVLAASLGGNIFLGWTTVGLRNRCRTLLRARM